MKDDLTFESCLKPPEENLKIEIWPRMMQCQYTVDPPPHLPAETTSNLRPPRGVVL